MLRKDLLPLSQKRPPAKRVLPYCPSIPQGRPLCRKTWDLPLGVPPGAVAGQAARVPAMRSTHCSQRFLPAPGRACPRSPSTLHVECGATD